ncbi:MAG TPA: Ig-like domain-containing protein [Myxococcales bacterium LLY-WYZ-16_1]|nr:Ig-like domain-containing protein [Myxococcales bacterium LLY-WYZ-16_1]
MQQLRNTSWMALALVGAFSVVACGDDGENGNGQGMGNGNPDMGSVDMPGNGGADMGPDGGMMEDAGNGEDPVLESLTPSPSTLEIREGQSDTVTITGDFDDGSSMQLSAGDLTLSSADEAVATAQALDDAVQVTGVGQGMTTITVSSGNVSAQVAVTVQPMDPGRTLVTINLTGVNDPIQLEVGDEALFLPRGVYDNTDNELLDPTELTLSSADDTICTLGAQGQQLVATGVAEGTTTLTVELDGVMATIGCEVEPAEMCPFGDEGCGCTPSTTVNMDGMTNQDYQQDDCANSDLRCVPFDRFTRNVFDIDGTQLVDGALATCVQNCTQDSDCGMGRFCQTDFRFWANFPPGGLEGVCVDRLAGVDEACKFSRRTREVINACIDANENPVPCGRLVPEAQMIGCEEGLSCVTGLLQPFVGGYVPSPIAYSEEGVCTELCETDNDCDAPATPDRSICSGSTDGPVFSNRGICIAERKELGETCGVPAMGAAWNASEVCYPDGDVEKACLNFGASGICAETCDSDGTCTGQLAGVDAADYSCDPQADLCDVTSCGADQGYVNQCEGGLSCRELFFTDMNNNIVATPSICAEELTPTWTPAEIDDSGTLLSQGDDCLPAMPTLRDVFSCPTNYTCVNIPGGVNAIQACLAFCDPDASDADTFCEGAIGTGSTCLDADDPNSGFALNDVITGDPLTGVGVCTNP